MKLYRSDSTDDVLWSQWKHSQHKMYFCSLNSYTCEQLQRLRPHAAIFGSLHALWLCNALEASQASFESTPVSGMRWQSSTSAYFCSENWAGYNKEREGNILKNPADPEGRNSRCTVFDILGVAAARFIPAGYIIQHWQTECLFFVLHFSLLWL